MATKHTPAPWKRNGSNRMVVGPEGNTVADVRYKNGEADVALIAAAPDLLEALKGIMTARFSGYDDNFELVYAAAEVAIAKAEGRA